MPFRVYEFIQYLSAVKNYSALTVEEYVRDLILFFQFSLAKKNNEKFLKIDKNLDLSFIDDKFLSSITSLDIYSFLVYCKEVRKNSPRTRRRKTSSIKGFFSFISDKMGYIPSNPATKIETPKDKKRIPQYLTLEQSIELLNSVDGENSTRDYCILTLFLNCGLRLAELCSLNISAIDFVKKTMLVTGKGNKQRIVYLNDACIGSLLDYLKVRPVDSLKGDDRNALFISRLNKRIGRQAVQLMVYHYLEKIGLNGQHYSVHKLRHTAATLMYQHADADLLTLKEMLGHENIATTEIYTHLEQKQLIEAVSKNPLAKIKKED